MKIIQLNNKINLLAAGFLCAASVLIANCKEIRTADSTIALLALASITNQNSGSNDQTSTIRFDLLAGTNAVSCTNDPATSLSIANYTNDGSTHNIKLQDARFYVSNIKLIDMSGNPVDVTLSNNDFQNSSTGVALLDFENKSGNCTNGTSETNTTITISYPSGNYKGIRFDVGIPDNYNRLYYQGSPAAGTPAVFTWSGMYWSWAGAYKFTKFEFKDTVTGNVSVLHLGSTGNSVTGKACDDTTDSSAANTNVSSSGGVPNSCIFHNRSTITLTAASFNPAVNSVALDLVSLFSGANTAWATGAGSTCMSGRTNVSPNSSTLKTPCTNLFANLGVSASNGGPTGSQTVFSIR